KIDNDWQESPAYRTKYPENQTSSRDRSYNNEQDEYESGNNKKAKKTVENKNESTQKDIIKRSTKQGSDRDIQYNNEEQDEDYDEQAEQKKKKKKKNESQDKLQTYVEDDQEQQERKDKSQSKRKNNKTNKKEQDESSDGKQKKKKKKLTKEEIEYEEKYGGTAIIKGKVPESQGPYRKTKSKAQREREYQQWLIKQAKLEKQWDCVPQPVYGPKEIIYDALTDKHCTMYRVKDKLRNFADNM
ncbi:MAG: hypothetical protein EZS28_043061, partial [Streblomastix strix]